MNEEKVTIIFDQHEGETLPYHFRVATLPYVREHPNPPSREGLDELLISGSEQPSVYEIKKDIMTLAPTVMHIDLRQESHGFLNGIPVSWFGPKNWANLGKDADTVMGEEAAKLESLLGTTIPVQHVLAKDDQGLITQQRTELVEVKEVATESQVAARLGLGYKRYALADHCPPVESEVLRFVEYFKTVPQGIWHHFHCHGGDGRTTTFMLLTDILRNGRKFSLEALALRQYLIGGVDLLKSPSIGYKAALYKERAEFIKRFYGAFVK